MKQFISILGMLLLLAFMIYSMANKKRKYIESEYHGIIVNIYRSEPKKLLIIEVASNNTIKPISIDNYPMELKVLVKEGDSIVKYRNSHKVCVFRPEKEKCFHVEPY